MSRVFQVFSDHLLVALTLAFALGIAMAFVAAPSDLPIPPLRVVALVFALVLLAMHFCGYGRPLPLLVTILLCLVGFTHAGFHLQPPSDQTHLFHRIAEKRQAIVTGTLLSAPEFDGKLSRVRIDCQFLRFPEDSRFLPTQGTLLLHLAAPWPTTILPGDQVVARADLKRPDGYRSPGAFDYQRHLALQNVLVSGFARSRLFVEKLAQEQSWWRLLHYAPERARSRLGQFIDDSVAEEHRGLYRAILIGDASAVDDQVLESFKSSGTIHILSISGLHLTIVGTLIYTGCYWLLSRSSWLLLRYPLRKWAAFLCLPALIGYALLAGMNVPVFRAMVMGCAALLAICGDRAKSPSTLLAAAALIILVVDPLSLALPTLQLSFAATAAILFLVPFLKTLLTTAAADDSPSLTRRIARWLFAGILVSTAATAATAPLTLHAFHRFSGIGIVANLVVEPLLCLWSLPCGLLALALSPVAPDFAPLLLHLGAPGLTAAVASANFFANLPFASLWRPSPPGWLMVICATSFLGIIWGWRSSRGGTLAASALFVLSLTVMLLPASLHPPRTVREMEATILDVGQGSASLLRFPSGSTILIDGGGSSATASSVGERVIAPYLWHQGITTLDALVITHPDADHYNGLEFILTHFPTKLLWVRDKQGHDKEYQKLLLLADRLRVRIDIPASNEALPGLGAEEQLRCLASPAGGSSDEIFPEHPGGNDGLVIKACYGQRCLLFPGDINRQEEERLIDAVTDLGATVLLSPHHGSASSNSRAFLAAVSPQYLLVSAGRSGRNRFPHPGLAEECRGLGIALVSTQERGTITVGLAADKIRLSGYGRDPGNPFLPYRHIPLEN